MTIKDHQVGLLAALGAFSVWGLAPIYFKLLGSVGADEIIAHRVVWSVLFLALVLLIRKGRNFVSHLKVSPGALLALALSGTLIAVNWLTFVYAVNTDRVLSTSLGYFINPLMSVVLGMLVFRERLSLLQMAAVLIAALGTGYMTVRLGQFPWIALVLASSFAAYSVVRKLLDVGPMVGLFWETLLVSPLALVWLGMLSAQGRLAFEAGEWGLIALLAGTGLLTVVPLLLFATGVRRLPLSTIGIMQYLAPSITFLLAVFAFGEPFSLDHGITFGCVWLGLVLFTASGWNQARSARLAARAS